MRPHSALGYSPPGSGGDTVLAVRLGFAALPGDKPGQRVFDIRLNGKTVLGDFDIIEDAGKVGRAVWKEFRIPIDGDLAVDLVAKTDTPKPDQMPLINGLVIDGGPEKK